MSSPIPLPQHCSAASHSPVSGHLMSPTFLKVIYCHCPLGLTLVAWWLLQGTFPSPSSLSALTQGTVAAVSSFSPNQRVVLRTSHFVGQIFVDLG